MSASVSVSQATADALTNGQYEIAYPKPEFIDCLTCGHRYHNHYRSEKMGKGCTLALCGCRRYEWKEARHLLPLLGEPARCGYCCGGETMAQIAGLIPPCSSCNGTGWALGPATVTVDRSTWLVPMSAADRHCPVATVVIEKVLPANVSGELSVATPHVSRAPLSGNLWLYGAKDHGTDVSHLLPYWPEGTEWAALITITEVLK